MRPLHPTRYCWTLVLLVVTSLASACVARENAADTGAIIDSAAAVQLARAALDSVRQGLGVLDTLSLSVWSYARDSLNIEVVFVPARREVQGGGGEVHLNLDGSVARVLLGQ